MDKIVENWKKILNKIKTDRNITDVSYNTWLEPLYVGKIENSTITIVSPLEEKGVEYIKNQYYPSMKEAISYFTGENLDVLFVSSEEYNRSESGNNSNNNNNKEYNSNQTILGINPRYTFDTFVVGNNNKFAHAASLAVAESPGTVYNPLFLYGGVGLGKTHLMQSIAHFIKTHHPNMQILYVTSEQFTNEVIDAIRNGNSSVLSKFREKYRNIDVLLVDDIQFIIGKESTQEEFFHTFNVLHGAGKQIIISSDRPPKDMNILEERIRSRFEWGLMTDIQSPDFETRVAILQKKQELDGFRVNQEILDYIATNIKSNIRELEGSLNRVVALAHLENRDANIELAREALKDIIVPNEKKFISPEVIIEKVSSYFNISLDDMKGKKRSKKISYPRQIAMYLIRELTDTKFEDIADILGGKDHTTVMYGVNKIEKMISEQPDIEEDVNKLKKIIST